MPERPVPAAFALERLSELSVGKDHGLSYKEESRWTKPRRLVMRETTYQKQVGGTTARVGDCYLWAAIHYLDSPTDYRECLASDRPLSVIPGEELVMLDALTPVPWVKAGKVLAATLSACTILLTIFFAFRF